MVEVDAQELHVNAEEYVTIGVEARGGGGKVGG